MKNIAVIFWALIIGLVAFTAGLFVGADAVRQAHPARTIVVPASAYDVGEYKPNEHQLRPRGSCTEDMPCFNCEIHGNQVCGPVNVEIYPEGDFTWTRVWDSHNRVVFGPVRLERIEM